MIREAPNWKGRIYIAGPLHSSGLELDNVRQAIIAWYSLVEAGFAAYIPHLNAFMNFMRPNHVDEFWLQHDFEWLATCHAVVRLPGSSRT